MTAAPTPPDAQICAPRPAYLTADEDERRGERVIDLQGDCNFPEHLQASEESEEFLKGQLLKPQDVLNQILAVLERRPDDAEAMLRLAALRSAKQASNQRWLPEAGQTVLETFQQVCLDLMEMVANRVITPLERFQCVREMADRTTRKSTRRRHEVPIEDADKTHPGKNMIEDLRISIIDANRERARWGNVLGAENAAWLFLYETDRWKRPSPYSGADYVRACRLRKKVSISCKDLVVSAA